MPEQKDVRSVLLQKVTRSRVDRFVSGKDNATMTTKRQRVKPKKVKEKTNQFGKPLAQAIKTTVYAWKCSECGHVMPYVGDKPPVRCSNRKGGCGRVFYNVEESP